MDPGVLRTVARMSAGLEIDGGSLTHLGGDIAIDLWALEHFSQRKWLGVVSGV